jgi:hypothetical protein
MNSIGLDRCLILGLIAQAVRAGKSTEAAAAEAQGRCRFVAREVDRRISGPRLALTLLPAFCLS